MSKVISNSRDSREALRRGINKVAQPVIATLGAGGKNIVLETMFGTVQTKDGATVANAIELDDVIENQGATLIKRVANETNDITGDGTTTATLLAQYITNEGLDAVSLKHNPVELRKGIDKAVAVITEELRKQAKPISSNKEIAKIGTISANGDSEIGEMIAEAMHKVGRDGVISYEESKTTETSVEITQGMQFDRGYINSIFINKHKEGHCELINPYVLIVNHRLSTLVPLFPLLQQIAAEQRHLLLIANDIQGEALNLLTVNVFQGKLFAVPVKAPALGSKQAEMLKDIAALTGATVVSSESGIALDKVNASHLGSAGRVLVKKDSTVITDGKGDSEKINERVDLLKVELSSCETELDKQQVKERVAKLAGGIAIIKVGASTESALKERLYRVEDAINATKAASEEGILAGGGVALLRASRELNDLEDSETNFDVKLGIRIIQQACEAPIRQILRNGGRQDEEVVIDRILNSENLSYGYDISTETYCDMIEKGIIDPYKVTKTALQKASSQAGLIINTDGVIAVKPEPVNNQQPPIINPFM